MIGESDFESDEQVSAFRRLFGKWKTVAGYPLNGGRFDDLVEKVEAYFFARQRRHVDRSTAQGLWKINGELNRFHITPRLKWI